MTASWVILTLGNRPAELEDAVASASAQAGIDGEVIVVANGADVGDIGDLGDLPAPARLVSLPENVGIPAGRNEGVRHAAGDIVFFLDDDAVVADPDVARTTREMFDDDPRLAAVSFRVADPESGQTQRRHVPRLRAGDPEHSSEVTSFLGGASAVRRSAFDEVGGFPDEFFYAMEETDLAWRLLDVGYRIEYRGDLVVHHPATTPARHGDAYRLTARNRVWMARRLLPWPLAAPYVGTWVVLSLARARSFAAVRASLAGFLEGFRRTRPGPRRPISWRTARRMTRLGRPPVI